MRFGANLVIKPLSPVLSAWASIGAAIAYGVIEWLALSRSRAIDRLAAWRPAVSRR